jgi:hypothetical protein
MKEYITKDSGKREEYASGMRRDTTEGKPRYDLIPVPLLTRLAGLYARGAEKYGDNNWKLANSDEELQRFKASGLRHLYQWLDGQEDEDHAIAAVWNIFAYETIKEKVSQEPSLNMIFTHGLNYDGERL